MGSWAGLIALYARETRGISSLSTGTSLALTASLMQFTHLGDGNDLYHALKSYFFHFHSISCSRDPATNSETTYLQILNFQEYFPLMCCLF
jgi:hypothetical protein